MDESYYAATDDDHICIILKYSARSHLWSILHGVH